MATTVIVILLIYWVYGCYVFFKIRPHWNETVEYTRRCRAEQDTMNVQGSGMESKDETEEAEKQYWEVVCEANAR